MDELKSSGKPFDISKQEVWDAWLKVKGNQGAPGVDGQSIEEFEQDLKNNLYRIWNRMSSGTYFPPPVKAVEIPKAHGAAGVRVLGVHTVADRVAQTVVAAHLERRVEPVFHPDSYGYRPNPVTRPEKFPEPARTRQRLPGSPTSRGQHRPWPGDGVSKARARREHGHSPCRAPGACGPAMGGNFGGTPEYLAVNAQATSAHTAQVRLRRSRAKIRVLTDMSVGGWYWSRSPFSICVCTQILMDRDWGSTASTSSSRRRCSRC